MDDATIKTCFAVCSLIMAVLAIPKGVIEMIAAVRGALGRKDFKNA